MQHHVLLHRRMHGTCSCGSAEIMCAKNESCATIRQYTVELSLGACKNSTVTLIMLHVKLNDILKAWTIGGKVHTAVASLAHSFQCGQHCMLDGY